MTPTWISSPTRTARRAAINHCANSIATDAWNNARRGASRCYPRVLALLTPDISDRLSRDPALLREVVTGFREQCPVWRHVANEQVLVYNSAGKQIAPIDVSEHLIDMVFGGGGHRTLFILSPHPLFALKVR